MHSDLQWFFGFILVVVVLAYMGWSAHKGGSLFSPATSTIAVQYDSNAGATQLPIQKTQEQEIADQIKQAQTEVTKLQGQVKQAEADANASPLRGKLAIASLSRGANAASEYVLIQAASENIASVQLTGLTLKSAVSHLAVTIPKAWRLPYPGGVGEGDVVLLAPGERAVITTGYSPNGMSFRLNRCTGFFAQSTSFTPSLPRECPSPVQELSPDDAAQLSEACIDYISYFPSCTTASSSLPPSFQKDGNCQTYVSRKISYGRCVALHRNEPGFYRGEWRIYLNRGETLWKARREVVELLDTDGKFISAYSY